jgi:DNA-binding response OmpR family regulator
MAAEEKTPTILIADDDAEMRELLATRLGTMKCKLIHATDGDEAWKAAKKHVPDLVILDVMMPGLSGWEVCRKIREDDGFAHTGVVMLTGIGERLNEMTSPLYGADAYIDKPFDFSELEFKVKKVISSRRRTSKK